MAYKIFETERLELKPSSIEDAAFFLELLNTTEWKENIGDRNVHNIVDAEEYIKSKILPDFEKSGFGNYTVVRKEDGIRIGSCGLYDRAGLEGVDIGFAFLPRYFGKGYAFEAASIIKNAAFLQFGLAYIQAITLETNVSSIKLIEKLGLSFEKKIRIPNDPEELLLYVLKKKLNIK